MASSQPFFLPVILPPSQDPSTASAYYASLAAHVGVSQAADGASLEITIGNSDKPHPVSQSPTSLPFSTVFALTSGFVRYYPKSAILPTPTPAPIDVPLTLVTANIGSLVLRVWVEDFSKLRRTPGIDRANRIVLGWLQESFVSTAISAEIKKMSKRVLEHSWHQAGGSVPVPERATLETGFLNRFMSGDAEVFVKAGTNLGRAAIVATSPLEVAQLKFQSYFLPDVAPSTPLAADDLVCDAADRLVAGMKIFENHPIVAETSGPFDVHFLSSFEIWHGRPQFAYEPFANANVRLMAEDGGQLAETQTDANGAIDLKPSDLIKPLHKGDIIYFEYQTNLGSGDFAGRHYTDAIETEHHRARTYVDANGKNAHIYRAKYEIYQKYVEFVDKLAENTNDESFEQDRGNMRQYEGKQARELMLPLDILQQQVVETKPSLTQVDFLAHMAQFETYYKTADLQKTTFNAVFEGDSWMNYPVDGNDVYRHLDGMIRDGLKDGIAYNRIPFQHFGDRSDQMFATPSGAALPRQWTFMEDALKEYDIDVIICSSGGNDLAEPGISNRLPSDNPSALAAPFKKCFKNGYFDPSLIATELPDQEDLARHLMEISFSVLLRNHLWNSYVNGDNPPTQEPEPSYRAKLAPLLAALNTDFGESDIDKQKDALEEIGKKVIHNMPSRTTLPKSIGGDAYDLLLAEVFDEVLYQKRFDAVKANWKRLLDVTSSLSIPVFTHSYCYPLFLEEPTTVAGFEITGPWFTPRFLQANITDRRIQKICLRSLIDNYVSYILTELRDAAAYNGLFDFANVARENGETSRWNDEIHLRSSGFKIVAEAILQKVKTHPALAHYFKP